MHHISCLSAVIPTYRGTIVREMLIAPCAQQLRSKTSAAFLKDRLEVQQWLYLIMKTIQLAVALIIVLLMSSLVWKAIWKWC